MEQTEKTPSVFADVELNETLEHFITVKQKPFSCMWSKSKRNYTMNHADGTRLPNSSTL
jgi:hypothetical protein